MENLTRMELRQVIDEAIDNNQAIKESSSTIKENSSAIKENSSAIEENSSAIKENSSAIIEIKEELAEIRNSQQRFEENQHKQGLFMESEFHRIEGMLDGLTSLIRLSEMSETHARKIDDHEDRISVVENTVQEHVSNKTKHFRR